MIKCKNYQYRNQINKKIKKKNDDGIYNIYSQINSQIFHLIH